MYLLYITDERVIIKKDDKIIFDGDPCIQMCDDRPLLILKDGGSAASQKDLNVYSPFHGCVMTDPILGSWFLNKIIKNRLFFKRDKCIIAISPVTAGAEISYIQYWYRRWYDNILPILIYEPIALLKGLNKHTGIVISLRYSMIEFTYVKDEVISHYWWRYHSLFKYKNSPTLNFEKYLDANTNVAQICNHIRSRLEREKASIVGEVVSRIKHITSDMGNREISIFFASYNNYTLFTYEESEIFDITRLDYDFFCKTILCGLE